MTKHKKTAIILPLVLVLIGFGLWLKMEPRFAFEAVDVEQYLKSDENVNVSLDDGILFFDGPGTEKALIFYPGAGIEVRAYAPLMHELAEGGMDCFLAEMPSNYAFLDPFRADVIIDNYSYESWNLAGHSLGGAIAAQYAAKTEHDIDGLYLLAAFPIKKVDGVDDILYIYGSRDQIVSLNGVKKGIAKSPDNSREYVISGGNHSQFGSYGTQKRDGKAEISLEEQISQTAAQILGM